MDRFKSWRRKRGPRPQRLVARVAKGMAYANRNKNRLALPDESGFDSDEHFRATLLDLKHFLYLALALGSSTTGLANLLEYAGPSAASGSRNQREGGDAAAPALRLPLDVINNSHWIAVPCLLQPNRRAAFKSAAIQKGNLIGLREFRQAADRAPDLPYLNAAAC